MARREAGLRSMVEAVFSDSVMTLLALLMIPLLLIQFTLALPPEAAFALVLVDWAVWFAFLLEFTARLAVARDRLRFLGTHRLHRAIDIIIIVSPLLSLAATLDPATQHELFVAPLLRVLRATRAIALLEMARPLAYAAKGLAGACELLFFRGPGKRRQRAKPTPRARS